MAMRTEIEIFADLYGYDEYMRLGLVDKILRYANNGIRPFSSELEDLLQNWVDSDDFTVKQAMRLDGWRMVEDIIGKRECSELEDVPFDVIIHRLIRCL